MNNQILLVLGFLQDQYKTSLHWYVLPLGNEWNAEEAIWELLGSPHSLTYQSRTVDSVLVSLILAACGLWRLAVAVWLGYTTFSAF